MKLTLIVFAKYPIPGKCKTRLIGALSAEQAAELQRGMTLHTLNWCRQLSQDTPAEDQLRVVVYFAGADHDAMRKLYGNEWDYVEQSAGNLGQKLCSAFNQEFSLGADRVLVVGTDCPTITASLAAEALRRINQHDVCIAPARDGGYVMLGISRTASKREQLIDQVIYSGIDWGTETVLRQTVSAVVKHENSLSLLACQSDVDRAEDLAVWAAVQENSKPPKPKLSVIIPVLDTEDELATSIATIEQSPRVEVLIVAAGDIQAAAKTAIATTSQLLNVPTGRAVQLNAGAAASRGEVLVFLHADTQLPESYLADIQAALENPDTVAGAFGLKLDSPRWSSRIVETGVALRTRWLHLPYGDQAIFVRRSVFEQLGGFKDLPIMEDYELVRRLKAVGKLALCDSCVRTSARRWHRLGAFRTTLINQLMVAGYHLGVPLRRLAKFYRKR